MYIPKIENILIKITPREVQMTFNDALYFCYQARWSPWCRYLYSLSDEGAKLHVVAPGPIWWTFPLLPSTMVPVMSVPVFTIWWTFPLLPGTTVPVMSVPVFTIWWRPQISRRGTRSCLMNFSSITRPTVPVMSVPVFTIWWRPQTSHRGTRSCLMNFSSITRHDGPRDVGTCIHYLMNFSSITRHDGPRDVGTCIHYLMNFSSITRHDGPRDVDTCIHYLMKAPNFMSWHQVLSDELFLYYQARRSPWCRYLYSLSNEGAKLHIVAPGPVWWTFPLACRWSSKGLLYQCIPIIFMTYRSFSV